MKTAKQLSHHINQVINTHGIQYTFTRYEKNDFGKPTDVVENTIAIVGLFHEMTSYVKVETSDGAQTKTKPQPMIMTSYEMSIGLKQDDIVIINDKKYKLVSITNVNNFNVVSDISLEVIQ